MVGSDLRAAKLRHFKSHGDEQGRVPCDITGQLIAIDEAHLDHAHWPFGTLIAMFREARGWHEVIATATAASFCSPGMAVTAILQEQISAQTVLPAQISTAQ